MSGILDCGKRGLSPFLLPFLLIVLGTWSSGAMAATCTATTVAPQPRNWSAAATWSCGNVPANGDSVVIPNGATVILDVNTSTLSDLNVNAGGTLRGDNTNKIFTINNGGGVDVTNNGTIDFGQGNLATIFLNKNTQWTGTGTWNLSTINLNNNKTLAFAAGSTMTINMSGAAAPFLNPGTVTSLSTMTWNFTGSVAQTLPASANVWYGNVTVSNTAGTTLGANLTTTNMLGNLTVASNGILNNGGFSVTLNAAKNFVMQANAQFNLTGTSTMVAVSGGGTRSFNATSTVNYGGANQTVTAETYGNLTLSGSGTKTMPATAMTVAGNFTMSGTATATAAAAISVGSNVTIGAGTTFNAGAFNHTVSGNWSSAGTFNAGTSTVILDGAVAQTISGTNPVSFNNLNVTNTTNPNITLATNVTVTGTLSGTVTLTSTCPIDWTLTSATPAQVLHSCPLDHISIEHASGQGLTCTPSTLTIKACMDAACSSLFTGGVTGTLTATGAGTPTVNWVGGTGFSIGVGGSVTKDVQVTTVGSTVFGTSAVVPVPGGTSPTCNFGTPGCTFTSSDSGLLFNVPHHVSEISQNITVSAVKKADNSLACTPAFGSVSKNVTFTCAYTNPASGTLPVRVGGRALNAGNNAAAACDGTGQAVSLAFNASGVASTTAQYADVGNMTLNAQYSGSGADAGLVMTGTDTFIAAPASFAFSAITAAPIKAGTSFSATVTAKNNAGGTTPNFGLETAAEGVTLTRTKYQPTGIGSSNGSFSGSVGAFSAGAATASNLIWSEVGTIDLTATLASGDYLSSGVTATGTTGVAGAVGPFVPDHFETIVTQGCSAGSYSYSGQPFTVQVKAKNGAIIPAVTVNYDGTVNTSPNFAKAVTLSDGNAAGVGTLAPTAVAVSDFTAGIATMNTPAYTFTSRQTAQTTIKLRAVDANASSSGFTEGTTDIRSGRAKLSNAHGSELLALPVTFRAEYWNSGWVLNSADSCSGDVTLGASNAVSVTLSASPATCVQDNGNPGLSGVGCAAAGPAAQRFKEGGVAGFAGNFNLWLKAPGSGNTGAVTVTGNVPAWLKYPWGGGAAIDPSSRATFGVYKGANEFIYLRENY